MLKKIPAAQLRQGMYLQELCGSWLDHPFWRSSFLIKAQKDVQTVVDCGVTEVMIDTSRGVDVEVPASDEPETRNESALDAAQPDPGSIEPERTSLTVEVERARKICEQARGAVTSMFNEVRMGKALDTKVATELVEEIAASVSRNPGALISIARLKTKDDYTYMHSVAVCGLMIALSKQLGLDEKQTREAGIGGLMHDLGKALMPLAILNKPGKLTDAEFATIRTHPEEGWRLLKEGGGAGGEVLDIALHHHEKIDGSGYPHRQQGDAISLMARMGAVCDVYDAITSNRPYKAGWDPGESVRRMASWQGHFDQRVLQAFVKSIGIYPVGSLVRFETGRLGVVIDKGNASLLKPRVKVFFSTTSNQNVPVEVIDLGVASCNDRIAGIEDASKWGFKNLDEMWTAV